jgi:choline dehydrogenase
MLANQQQLTSNLKDTNGFIICYSGSSGSVVARRLAENADVSVMLLVWFLLFLCVFFMSHV